MKQQTEGELLNPASWKSKWCPNVQPQQSEADDNIVFNSDCSK
jgi:hypothetical protein